jgi:outer membrane immunogenic protein
LVLTYNNGVEVLADKGHDGGLDAGAEAGYDARIGKSVIAGAYAGIEFADTKECSPVDGNDSFCLKLGRNVTVGARLGAKVSDRVLLYVKGGYSNGQLRGVYRNSDDPSLDFNAHSNRTGYHLGVGGEMAMGPNGYVRLEYVHTIYDDFVDPDLGLGLDGHRDQVLAGFGLRF